jgi:endoglucanase
MNRPGSVLIWLLLFAAAVAPARVARAAGPVANGLQFSAPAYTVDENAGAATIAVVRSAGAGAAQVAYATAGLTAQAPYDFAPVSGTLSFAAGQTSASFRIPIVDHGVQGMSKTIRVSLHASSTDGPASSSTATLTILDNDPVAPADPSDPLGLAAATTRADPLTGARFFVDPHSEAARAARTNAAISVIADEPGVARFGSFSYPNAGVAVSRYLARAAVEQPGTIPMLTTYRVVDGHCGNWSDPPADVESYENFVNGLAQGIGSYRAVLFLEQDSLITIGCLSQRGVAVRMQELNYAIRTLTTLCPHVIIYLDAGAADAVPARQMAQLLIDAGVSRIQGFFLDATHFDWPLKEIRYGQQVSRLTGGAHFVVSTGESGEGPLIPQDRATQGNEVLCNPPGRGLGPKPTTDTGFADVDAFEWLDNPGGSSGACVPGAPAAGVYWPAYALMLIRNANYAIR